MDTQLNLQKERIFFFLFGVILLMASCAKSGPADPLLPTVPPPTVPTPTSPPQQDTLLNINYEGNTTNSGIIGVNPTNASAADAVYMVSSGATGNYAVAHKVVHGDNTYYSDGAYRSESDMAGLAIARFQPGQERRYEFSLLLKDWPAWQGQEHIEEVNLFQLKVSDNKGEPVRVARKRNSIVSRRYNTSQENMVDDILPYINQWMHFRIDVKWATDATGYMKIYAKLPGQSDYVLKVEQYDYPTFLGDIDQGNIGYLKWGIYGLPEGATRIAYHDDIRIIALN